MARRIEEFDKGGGVHMAEVSSLAVFVDFENLALGFQNRRDRFDIQRVLQRLVEKGKIIVKKGYADWSRFSENKRALHEAGLELIEIPRRAMTGKNSADIHLVVDAMDLSYSKEHIDTFVIVSGDSDFSPLVSKLKENGKRVIGLAMRNSTSELLVNSCDEFIFYEDLEVPEAPGADELGEGVPTEKRHVFRLLLETLTALQREVSGPIYASMVKDTIRRKQPSFFESAYGYRTFSALLEDAQTAGLLQLSTDPRSGTYVVTGFQAPSPKRTRRGGRRRANRGATGKTTVVQAPETSVPGSEETADTGGRKRSRGTRRTTRTTRKAVDKSTSMSDEAESKRAETSKKARAHRKSANGRRRRPRRTQARNGTDALS
ncbi:MAG: NYN domain-containing protein [Candidatus Krumholzibacteriia bacterium]